MAKSAPKSLVDRLDEREAAIAEATILSEVWFEAHVMGVDRSQRLLIGAVLDKAEARLRRADRALVKRVKKDGCIDGIVGVL